MVRLMRLQEQYSILMELLLVRNIHILVEVVYGLYDLQSHTKDMAEGVVKKEQMQGINTRASITTITTAGTSWTATKDCWIVGSVTSKDGTTANVNVNGVAVAGVGNTATSFFVCFPVKKGQTVTTRNADASKVGYNLTAYEAQ